MAEASRSDDFLEAKRRAQVELAADRDRAWSHAHTYSQRPRSELHAAELHHWFVSLCVVDAAIKAHDVYTEMAYVPFKHLDAGVRIAKEYAQLHQTAEEERHVFRHGGTRRPEAWKQLSGKNEELGRLAVQAPLGDSHPLALEQEVPWSEISYQQPADPGLVAYDFMRNWQAFSDPGAEQLPQIEVFGYRPMNPLLWMPFRATSHNQ